MMHKRFRLDLYLRTISRSSQCSTTGVPKAWYVLSCQWDDAYKKKPINRKE